MEKVTLTTFTDPMMGLSYECEPVYRRLEVRFGGRIAFPAVRSGAGPASQRKRHRLAVQPLQNSDERRGALPPVPLMADEDAGEGLFAVKGYPRELPAVIVQKSRRKADAASGSHIG